MKTKTAGQPWKNHDIRSPQAPTDIEPVPLADRSPSDLGFNVTVMDNLRELGITTIGELLEAMPDEEFIGIPGVGEKGAEKAAALLEAYRS